MSLNSMTLQQMFTQAACGLASQKWVRSTGEGLAGSTVCKYRGAEGRRCAVGWCLTEGEYACIEEGDVAEEVATTLKVEDDRKVDLLMSMQNAHDTCKSPERMRENFVVLASDYDLSWPEGL
jgi:hypothetical protein